MSLHSNIDIAIPLLPPFLSLLLSANLAFHFHSVFSGSLSVWGWSIRNLTFRDSTISQSLNSVLTSRWSSGWGQDYWRRHLCWCARELLAESSHHGSAECKGKYHVYCTRWTILSGRQSSGSWVWRSEEGQCPWITQYFFDTLHCPCTVANVHSKLFPSVKTESSHTKFSADICWRAISLLVFLQARLLLSVCSQ